MINDLKEKLEYSERSLVRPRDNPPHTPSGSPRSIHSGRADTMVDRALKKKTADIRTFVGHRMLYWTYRMGFILEVFLITVVAVTLAECAHGHGRDLCKGNQVYPDYPHCRCGTQFVRMVKKRHIPKEDIGQFHARNMNGRIRYYLCTPCTICEDGVRQIAPCRNLQDTKCGGCVTPGYVYDNASKTCSPRSYINGDPENLDKPESKAELRKSTTATTETLSTEVTRSLVLQTITSSRRRQDNAESKKPTPVINPESEYSAKDGPIGSFTSFYVVVVVVSVMVIVGVSTALVIIAKKTHFCRRHRETIIDPDGREEQEDEDETNC
ncbi:uncharacterized protein [Ptychodera flava]|uniref:uncharacterized protein n=1 Tax=Ptychodera flava TaxID=63121 RepID=UPI003969D012